MKKIVIAAVAGICAISVWAGSEAAYPAAWKTFTAVNTPLMEAGGALPGCDADVSSLPKVYQETVATYCAVKEGGPGAVEILVSPSALATYKARNGTFQDGDTLILHLKELQVLFVTSYKDHKPLYGVYDETGKDVASAEGSGLHPNDCRTCHTGYEAFGINGQMGTLK
ncbi:MAG: hypothetical protein DSZ03_03360 [Sulfurimonas sp.]|nr:MAG: hypothetical protein DSZ03_03360 [Sulfurimonas sp.]